MRKLVIVLGVFIAIVAAGLVTLLLFLNQIVAANHQYIVDRASAAVGRPIAVREIRGSLRGGVGVRLEQVRLGDAPEFGKGDFFSADSLMVHVRLVPLLSGHLEFERIDAERPVVSLIRNRNGEWNYAAFASGGGERSATGSAASPAKRGGPSIPVVMLGNIAQGRILMRDEGASPARTIDVNQVDLALSDLSMTLPTHFALSAAVDAQEPNIRVKGEVRPTPDGPLSLSFSGKVGPFGSLAAEVARAELVLTPGEAIQIVELEAETLGGTLAFQGRYPLQEQGALTAVGTLKAADLGQLAEVLAEQPQGRVAGSAEFTWNLKGQGASSAALRKSLDGNLKVLASDVRIANYNLLHDVLSRFSGLPGLGMLLSDAVNQKYRHLLSDDSTSFKSLAGTFNVSDQRVRTDDLQVLANDFELQGRGSVDFNQRVDVQTTLLLSQSLSSDIVGGAKEARFLAAKDGRIQLVVRWRGSLSSVRPEPDAATLGGTLQGVLSGGAGRQLMDRLKDWLH
ncbi:MAG TPA: AsmA-like C-terminal region-containing protein [Candidatus Acidoferrales bacterium]|nr:AsmA-like C-terminal region-containing protein [Candidatus Acidoferrales bacterium]